MLAPRRLSGTRYPSPVKQLCYSYDMLKPMVASNNNLTFIHVAAAIIFMCIFIVSFNKKT
jgi:hypothetical protein